MIKGLVIIFFLFFSFFTAFAEADWYKSQRGTGQGGNCGPASVAMAFGWYNMGKSIAVKRVRSIIGNPFPDGGTSFANLTHALRYFGVPYNLTETFAEVDLERILIRGNIAIILYQPSLISESSQHDLNTGINYHLSDENISHYSVMKGEVPFWFLVYDPMPKGKDRYYLKKQLYGALKSTVVIEILKKEIKG